MSERRPTSPLASSGFDVLVVGAGPAGLSTALGLARQGVRAMVVEKHASTSTYPKASGVRPRTLEIFRAWGMADRVRAAAQDVQMAVGVSETFAGPVLSVDDPGMPDRDYLMRVTPEDFAFVPQDRLEPVLVDEVRRAGGEVRFGTQLIGFECVDGGVVARLRSTGSLPGADTATDDVSVRFLVGADGARSDVRRMLGIPMRRLGSHGHHVGALFTAELDRLMPGPRYALRWAAAPGAEGLLVASGPGRWTLDWEVRDADAGLAVTHEDAARRIRAATGVADLDIDVQRVFPWEMAAELADSMRSGPVFLVGDAAHRTTPRGATGMNTGVAAAQNLAWKLAWVLRGWADEDLLETYEAERFPVGRENTTASLKERGDLPEDPGAMDFGVTYDLGQSEATDLGFVSAPGLGTVIGRRAPHAWLDLPDGSRVSTLDLFEGRLTLVAGADHEPWRAAVASVTTAPAPPVQVIAIGVDALSPDGRAADLFGLREGGAVLVRPDGHVAWRAPGIEDHSALQAAVNRATARSRRSDCADAQSAARSGLVAS